MNIFNVFLFSLAMAGNLLYINNKGVIKKLLGRNSQYWLASVDPNQFGNGSKKLHLCILSIRNIEITRYLYYLYLLS